MRAYLPVLQLVSDFDGLNANSFRRGGGADGSSEAIARRASPENTVLNFL